MPTIRDDFKVEILVNESLINVQEIKVLIRKPNTIVFDEKMPTSLDLVNNIVKYSVTSVYNDIAGEWIFKVRIKNSEGDISTTINEATSGSVIIEDLP